MTTDQTPSKEELEAEITELRQSVGETVDALSRRLDVKGRARSVPTAVPVGIAAAVVAGIGFWLWRRRG
jgi:hypothetical protein